MIEQLKNADIEKTLVVSTCHMTKADNDLLERATATSFEPSDWGRDLCPHGTECLPITVYPFHYGFSVHVSDDFGKGGYRDALLSYGLSESFLKVLDAGKSHGVKWVKFDCDGTVYEELPIFDW